MTSHLSHSPNSSSASTKNEGGLSKADKQMPPEETSQSQVEQPIFSRFEAAKAGITQAAAPVAAVAIRKTSKKVDFDSEHADEAASSGLIIGEEIHRDANSSIHKASMGGKACTVREYLRSDPSHLIQAAQNLT